MHVCRNDAFIVLTMQTMQSRHASNPEPINFLFNKTADQMRAVGARGGRARCRNLRTQRRECRAAPVATVIEPDVESTAEAIAMLDTQFPWLIGAERKRIRNRAF